MQRRPFPWKEALLRLVVMTHLFFIGNIIGNMESMIEAILFASTGIIIGFILMLKLDKL